jgi:hypothetical protein
MSTHNIHPDLVSMALPLTDLHEDPDNARKHDGKNIDAIASSLERFGQRTPIVVQRNGMIVRAGNGRLVAAQELGWTHIAVLVVDEEEIEARAFSIADNRSAELAEWDDDVLARVLEELSENGVESEVLGFDEDDIAALTGEVEEDDEPGYTQNIKAPVYEPQGDCPEVETLCDPEKADRLCEDIAAADLPDDVRTFLYRAAGRHVVFNYERIANFYAHSDADVQRLFEDSALVIIDYDRAVEQGFVRLNDQLDEVFREDFPDA